MFFALQLQNLNIILGWFRKNRTISTSFWMVPKDTIQHHPTKSSQNLPCRATKSLSFSCGRSPANGKVFATSSAASNLDYADHGFTSCGREKWWKKDGTVGESVDISRSLLDHYWIITGSLLDLEPNIRLIIFRLDLFITKDALRRVTFARRTILRRWWHPESGLKNRNFRSWEYGFAP